MSAKKTRKYKSYSKNLDLALQKIKSDEMSLSKAAKTFGISKGTLFNKIHNRHNKSVGCPTIFSKAEEKLLVSALLTVSEWGFPFSGSNLKNLAKNYLDCQGKKILDFGPTNTPGKKWLSGFLNRNKNQLTFRKCQNIKSTKADITKEDLENYFKNLKKTLTDDATGKMIFADRIFNYDETNLSDDPGVIKCVFKRGVKYPERITDSTKSSISIMFCGSANGNLIPPYVVYKSEHLWQIWVEGGPLGTRYNRSKSGWFDGPIFRDWFCNHFVPGLNMSNAVMNILKEMRHGNSPGPKKKRTKITIDPGKSITMENINGAVNEEETVNEDGGQNFKVVEQNVEVVDQNFDDFERANSPDQNIEPEFETTFAATDYNSDDSVDELFQAIMNQH